VKILSILSLLAVFALGAGAAGTPPAAQSKADADHAALQTLLREAGSGDAPHQDTAWWEDHFKKASAEALKFYESHPTDRRRWWALNIHLMYVRNLTTGAESRQKRADELMEQALASEGVPDQEWQQLKMKQINNQTRVAAAESKAGRKPDLTLMRKRIDELAARVPEAGGLVICEMTYQRLLAETDPAAGRQYLEQLAQSKNEEVRRVATGKLKVQRLREEPLQMKFTAVDGRQVDLQQLRGKVVLLDFWATWCGPCVAEIPNIKAVYDRYHAQGFEVVGISLDLPTDVEKLRAFVKERDIPWPQFLDSDRKNRYAAEFGVIAIPTQLLLGRDGRLVSDNARGEVLQREVARLFGGAD
jgi:thiol-disulfide isomerase/thioredoxin